MPGTLKVSHEDKEDAAKEREGCPVHREESGVTCQSREQDDFHGGGSDGSYQMLLVGEPEIDIGLTP